MKQIKFFLMLLCSIFIVGCAEKEEVSPVQQVPDAKSTITTSSKWTFSEAEAIAIEALTSKESDSRANSFSGDYRVKESYVYVPSTSRSTGAVDTVFYIINMEPAGFVIVKADKGFEEPVFAYSTDGQVGVTANPTFDWYMDLSAEILSEEIRNRNDVSSRSSISRANQPVTGDKDLCSEYYNGVLCWRKVTSTSTSKRSPLLTTTWNQGYPYNLYCNWYPVGCVAVALGQIFAYHRYPAELYSHQYVWDEMLAAPNASDLSFYGQDCVAHLLRDIGAFVQMVYGADGSAPKINTYGKPMNQALSSMGYSSDDNLIFNGKTVRSSLSDLKPVFIHGHIDGTSNSGHAWVVDGYNSSFHRFDYIGVDDGVYYGSDSYEVSYYHFNMGWGGNHDGYYECKISTSVGGDKYTLIYIIPNITPRL